MNGQNRSEHRLPASEAAHLSKNSKSDARISRYVEQAHSVKILHIIAASCEILLGFAVLTVSMINLIEPDWISEALGLLSSVSVMVGIYFLYTVLYRNMNQNRLLSEAMKRAIDAQN